MEGILSDSKKPSSTLFYSSSQLSSIITNSFATSEQLPSASSSQHHYHHDDAYETPPHPNNENESSGDDDDDEIRIATSSVLESTMATNVYENISSINMGVPLTNGKKYDLLSVFIFSFARNALSCFSMVWFVSCNICHTFTA